MPRNIKSLTKGSHDWNTTNETVTHSDLQLSCLMRIADATEAMAQPFAQMASELERYKKWYAEEREENKKLKLSIIAHKAAYSRLKNKQRVSEEGAK
jgi:septal ring factor EnvC (AmiA/AmiB activator)